MNPLQLPPLLTGYLLGKHVELRFHDGRIKRGVVVRLKLVQPRGLTLTEERGSDYDETIGCWLPRRPREEDTYDVSDIETIMVVDRNETLVPDESSLGKKWT
jgi:hypothetical protein